MSDIGLLTYYLGIEVKQGDEGMTLSQCCYAKKIIEKRRFGRLQSLSGANAVKVEAQEG
jgi:hypothetical protein